MKTFSASDIFRPLVENTRMDAIGSADFIEKQPGRNEE